MFFPASFTTVIFMKTAKQYRRFVPLACQKKKTKTFKISLSSIWYCTLIAGKYWTSKRNRFLNTWRIVRNVKIIIFTMQTILNVSSDVYFFFIFLFVLRYRFIVIIMKFKSSKRKRMTYIYSRRVLILRPTWVSLHSSIVIFICIFHVYGWN